MLHRTDQRHHLEARFRKLCRAIAQLGAEKKGRNDTPRPTASRRRSSGTSKKHFNSACWTSSGEFYSGTRSTPIPEDFIRGQYAFHEALDEAKGILADVRGSQPGVVAASLQEAFPAWKTHISVQDKSANVSISYKEGAQTASAANRGGGSSTHEPGGKGKRTKQCVRSNPPRPRRRPEELGCKQPDVVYHPSSRASGSFDEGTRRRKATPRRVKTVCVEAKRGGKDAKGFKVRLELNNGSNPESSNSDYNASKKGIHTGPCRKYRTAPCRSAPLHQGVRAINTLKEDPFDRQHSKQGKRAGEYEPKEERRRSSSSQDNERTYSQWQEKQHEPTLGKLKAGGEICFDGDHQEIEPEGEERHITYDGVSKRRGGWNQQYSENTRAEETEEGAGDQQRWRNRGRVLWSTHAEPAARATSSGSSRAAPHTVRSHSQPATRPYYGLYARSLRANGIDPTNFRTSRCGYDAADLNCAVAQRHVDGSLLWRGNRGDDSFAAERARAPTDGLSDRLEAGRVLDSLNRRAELLGTMPPTPLRAKAAWMETPGDPEYRYYVQGTGEGALLGFVNYEERNRSYGTGYLARFLHIPDKKPARYSGVSCLQTTNRARFIHTEGYTVLLPSFTFEFTQRYGDRLQSRQYYRRHRRDMWISPSPSHSAWPGGGGGGSSVPPPTHTQIPGGRGDAGFTGVLVLGGRRRLFYFILQACIPPFRLRGITE